MKIIRDFFTISAREKKGTLILLSLIVVISVALQFPSVFAEENIKYDYSSFEEEILKAESAIANPPNENKSFETSHYPKNKSAKKAERFFFDPNLVSEDEMIRLGFFPSLAGRIINYRNKGGRFKTGSDLQKIYGMSPSFYNELEQWIVIEKEQVAPVENQEKRSNNFSVVNLNSADTLELMSLPGIGPTLSKRIIKYRESLGGFVSAGQLKEVYGLKEEVINSLEGKIVVTGSVQKININVSSPQDLKKHPYIDGKLASVIVQYRNRHGNYASPQDIKNTDLVDEELYLKIAPYITAE